MAKDNNNINITDELTSGGGGGGGGGEGAGSSSALKQQNRLAGEQLQQPDLNGRAMNGQLAGNSSSTEGTSEEGGRASSTQQQQQQRDADGVGAIHELPRREENPFSFKHFLKRDSSLGASSSTATNAAAATNINHSRSASSINGSNNGVATVTTISSSNHPAVSPCQPSTSGASPSKSATTSSLHNTSTTGAKPKIPQFQSVNTLSSESKMKRSPRFPSFDSQSSLSDLADDKFMANIYHSRSNNSFNSDYPLAGSSAAAGSSGSQQYVQRSYSNYDMESPGSVESPRLVGSQNLHNSPNFGGRSRENLAAGHRLGASEFSAALPDFVQDHLVMEQWYNQMSSPKSGSPVSVDFDHLPDFAVNNLEPEASGRGHGSIINDMPFDLTAVAGPSSQSTNRNRTPIRNASPNVPLDLPPQNLDFSFDLPRRRTTPPHQPSAAPELPPDLTDAARSGYYRSSSDNHSPSPSSSAADNKIHRLPDFLSDGPIHSSGRLADVTHDTPHFNSPADASEASHHHHRQENDRLRRELEDSRRIVAEQVRRICELERALEVAKSSAHRVEGFEENLDKSYLRAATAESQVLSLRQKIKKMTSDMEALRLENEMLKEGGAMGGPSTSSDIGPGPSGIRSGMGARRGHPLLSSYSRELRQAAASAENNLRQLLTGVDNLRMMASTMENIDRIDIPPHPDDFLSDSDDDDLLGPAL